MHRPATLVLAALLPSLACVLPNPDFDGSEAGSATGLSTGVSSATATATTTTDTATTSTASASTASASETATATTEPTSGTLTTTGSTSGTSGTGSSGSDSDTSGGVGVCGDGSVDPGEECDDGNPDGGDGCSALCHTEPTGILLGEESTTEQAGDGNLFENGTCSSVFVGLEGRLDVEQWHCRPSFLCADLNLGPDLKPAWTDDGKSGPFGDPCFQPATAWARPCPPDHALVGTSGRVGSVFDKIQPRCAPIEITEGPDGFAIGTGAIVDLEAVGSDGGDPYGPYDCPPNAVAVAATLRAGNRLEALRFTCASLGLSYD